MTLSQPIEQRLQINSGEKTWDDFTFEERTCKGWLIPYLVDLDLMFNKRWDYWLRTLEAGELLGEPIPQIDFTQPANNEAVKMLNNCLTNYVIITNSISLNDFLKWLLWGFSAIEEKSNINEKVNEYWYRTFNLGLLLKYPYDYLADVVGNKKLGSFNNTSAFFSTPAPLCNLMSSILFEGSKKDNRGLSVLDPCVGTGSILLSASNYSLNLYAQDIDLTCVMACKINGYLYMPWLVKPGAGIVKGINKLTTEQGVKFKKRSILPIIRSKLK
jgi:type I restriction-modification system DNA methylase subunit